MTIWLEKQISSRWVDSHKASGSSAHTMVSGLEFQLAWRYPLSDMSGGTKIAAQDPEELAYKLDSLAL